MLANNSIEHLLCYFGVMSYGATICTVHVEMNRNQLDNILDAARSEAGALPGRSGARRSARRRCGAETAARTLGPARRRHLLSRRSRTASRAKRRPTAGPDDDAVILFTSGTSAQPKGVVLDFREHLGNIDPTAEGFGIGARRPGVRFPLVQLGVRPTARRARAGQPRRHAGDGGEVLGEPLTSSMSATTASRSRPATRRPSTSCSTPTTARSAPTSPSLRFITSSSAPLTVEEWRRFEDRFGIPIAQGYGSSETGWIAAIPGEQRRLGTVGRPLAYHDLAIVDADGRRLPAGQIGQVEIGGIRRPRLSLPRRGRQREDQQPRPHPHRRSRHARRRRLSSASPGARRN